MELGKNKIIDNIIKLLIKFIPPNEKSVLKLY